MTTANKAHYSDIISDGGLDPRNEADSDSARMERHRKASSAMGGIMPHPSAMGYVHIDSIESSLELRTRLVELGWTPPNPHTIEAIPTVAWQHPARSDLVTSDPNAYTSLSAGAPHKLVRQDAVVDRIDWLEHGIDEWRATALQFMQQKKDLLIALKAAKQMLDNLNSAYGSDGVDAVSQAAYNAITKAERGTL